MGSSGGGWSKPSLSLEELLARSATHTEQVKYEAELASLLNRSLGGFNNRDVDAIRRHMNTLLEALMQSLEEGSVSLLYGGSVEKHTYVNGLSDVDLLTCLNDTSLENLSPTDVLNKFAQHIKKRLPRTSVEIGELAVTVKFSDGHEIQILPSIRTARGFRIADPDTGNWSSVVFPRRFARKLTEVNQKLAGKVVPVIKLAKALNTNLPKPQRLSGYHIESMAIEAFRDYSGRQTYHDMSRHFWQFAHQQVLRPIVDSTGQSRHVDDCLGSVNSVARQKISNAIGRIVSKIESADRLRSVDMWQELLEL